MAKPAKQANSKRFEAELEEAVQKILQSTSRRRLVVAGPGTGKTTLFQKLLEGTSGDKKTRLVLTFINNLRDELEKSLSHLCKVSTLHGYCQSLLRSQEKLRGGLSGEFVCQPEMASIIKLDWTYLRASPAPHFVDLMRNLVGEKELLFYFERANYYDAVDFDDSVYRTCVELIKNPGAVPDYDLVLIDEYQDFNRMEAAFIETLAKNNPIVVAGDDDQALYSQLRGASWDYIRSLHNASDYEVFQLPFCMRCPEVVVGAVNDVISEASRLHKLEGRIEKDYRHYEPLKGGDSRKYPKLLLINATVQRRNANYFGRFIDEVIERIPAEEIKQANEKGEPVVLIIGSVQYLRQIEEHLVKRGRPLMAGRVDEGGMRLENGFALLKEKRESNLGWRIVLEFKNKELAASCVRKAANKLPLHEVIPKHFKDSVLAEIKDWSPPKKDKIAKTSEEPAGLTVKLTSFQGAKGLSAQHVFIVGLHAGDLPRDEGNIQDLEICKFLVGLTRTKKRCALLWTNRFANDWKQASVFLKWIKPDRYEHIHIDAKYWDSKK